MVEKYREWKEIEKGLRETKQMLVESEDAEMKQLAHDEERRSRNAARSSSRRAEAAAAAEGPQRR